MSEGFVPPAEVRANAKRGLELREKHGRGGTEVGVARARDLSNGASISLDTIHRMVSYFARHEVDKQGEGWGKDSAGYIAWLLWGGDAGRSWANRISKENEKKDKALMNDFTTAYASILKYDENDDGTLMVYGNATDDSLDLDQQICDPAWLEKAMPDWFTSGGNIREMHGPNAAGVAKEYENKNGKHIIGVHVVDPLAVKKVKTQVYRGFSVGIKAPRVVRDNKAANGRIIDGSIIEVSLVDRPANPNAKLILAKSVDGESTLVQVEEMHEYKAPLPSDIAKKKETDYASINEGGEGSEPADKELYNRVKAEAKEKFDVYPSAVANAWVVREYKSRGGKYQKKTEKGSKMETIKQITELAKSLTTDTVKFDQVAFDAARRAVAALIVAEASEMGEGADESYSLNQLIEVANHLIAWYQGEVQEGEAKPMSDIELSADAEITKEPDTTMGCKCDGCMKCAADGGCDAKMCSMHKGMHKDPEPDAEKSAGHKCLECGCNTYDDAHGRTDVSTAEIVDLGAEKSAEADATVDATAAIAEAIAEQTPEVSEGETSEDEGLKALVAEAVKSAMEKFEAEKAALVAEKESAVEKALSLETELATALEKTVAGGPKRTATKLSTETQNAHITKALQLKAKADASTDPLLARGYLEMANDEFKAAGIDKPTL